MNRDSKGLPSRIVPKSLSLAAKKLCCGLLRRGVFTLLFVSLFFASLMLSFPISIETRALAQEGPGKLSASQDLKTFFQLSEEAEDRGISNYAMALPGMGSGVAAVDFDNDADIDLLVPRGHGLPDAVYRNDGTGHFLDVAQALGVDSSTNNRAMLVFDIDGDRRGELFVFNDDLTQSTFIRCYKQLVNGTFVDVTAFAGLTKQNTPPPDFPGHIGGAAAGDINNDGFLDFFVALWGESNSCFLNNGDGTFTDISDSSGLAGEETGLYWQPLFHDFDGDGWLDLYLNVDEGENQLMLNEGDLTFVDVAGQSGADPHMNCMGVAAIDIDGDRDLDLFISNVYELAGDGEHDVLLRNRSESGLLSFSDVSYSEKVVAQNNWGWGCTWADLDNDLTPELVETNGWYWGVWETDPAHIWQRRASGAGYREIGMSTGYDHTDFGSCVVAADLNRDGRLDLVETILPRDFRVYINSPVPNAAFHNYIVVKPRLIDQANYRAIGALVDVEVGGVSQTRLITAGTSLLGQEPAEAHFGLGPHSVVDTLTVRFPDGRTVVQHGIPANQVFVVIP